MSEADRIAAQSLRDMEAAPGLVLRVPEEQPAKYARVSQAGGKSSNRHIETEQRRRDRINEGFQALRDLMPAQEKMDKASFLMAAVDYIRKLQDQMQQLLVSGAISKLPEEVQWNVRVLLPRAQDMAASGQGPAASGNLGSVQNLSAGMLASLPLAASAAPQTPPVAAQQQGQDVAAQLQSMLAQAALVQQLQVHQSAHSQLMQLLQLNQLVQGSSPDPSGNPMAALIAQLAQGPQAQQAPGSGLAGFNLSALLGSAAPSLSPAASQPTPTGCCAPTPASQDASTPKVRRGAKVRRHTTASKLGQPSPPLDASHRDGRPQLNEML
ncbi:g129 [Coccomyxa viridis]|uniref:G129 protein n=1 Tax=Coccomyxa viridis TaxID=1274662 RepID=A0ABP1FEY7_9CHLO